MQSLIVWASNNNGSYPLPSQLDVANMTVAEKGRAKDTTANILSLLIFNGHISTEMCICPDEANKRIANFEDYEYSNPKKAVKPQEAMWDPAFSTDFTKGKGNWSWRTCSHRGVWT